MTDPISPLEHNRRLALEFIGLASENSMDAALALLDPQATWWVAGDPTRLKVAGLKNRAQIERLFQGLKKAVPGGMRMTVHGVTAEGARVAVELEGLGTWHNGKTYHNRYHFMFEIRGSLITTVREYMDTLHLHEVSQS